MRAQPRVAIAGRGPGPTSGGAERLAWWLGMPADTLGHWVRCGWVEHRKLPGAGGAAWCSGPMRPKLHRLGRLRAFRSSSYPLGLSPELDYLLLMLRHSTAGLGDGHEVRHGQAQVPPGMDRIHCRKGGVRTKEEMILVVFSPEE